MKEGHISLLDNRKHLSPRASMESLISYARLLIFNSGNKTNLSKLPELDLSEVPIS